MTNTNNYDSTFYNNVNITSLESAEIILPKLLELFSSKIKTAVDFGCAEGVWLRKLMDLGINEVLGIDGPWVQQTALKIPADSFITANLGEQIVLKKKYDLAISLEVAEHIPQASAETFVHSLTNAADFILFSAAIPYQGGTDHINEQWPIYWNALFNKYGFIAVDYLRQQLWKEKKVNVYYKQNILLYVNKERKNEIKIQEQYFCMDRAPKSIVHPKLFFQRLIVRIIGKKGVNLLIKIKNKLKKKN
jgi:hypothetical protein